MNGLLKDKRKRSILFLVLAAILWSTGGFLIKLVTWNPIAIAGARSGISAILMFIYVKKPKLPKTKPMIFGACSYAATVICFVLANKLTTSANAILLQYTAPIWVAIFGGIILKERTRHYDWISIFFVMIGMGIFFISDLNSGNMLGNLIAVGSGITLSLTFIFIRLQEDGQTVTMTLWGNVLTFIISIPFMIGPMPSGESIIGLTLLGVFQLGFSYILFSESAKHVSTIESILIPVLEPLLNPIWVFFIVGETPSTWAVIGGMVVMSAVVGRALYVSRYEKIITKKAS